jgi:FixJ family two-component response regulator
MPKAAPVIAILDDEAEMRKAIRRLLTCRGYLVEEYEDGEALFVSLDSHSLDCLLLDLHMPGMNGFDVLETLRSRKVTVPVIVITAHDEPGTAERVLGLGASSFLKKPVDKDELLAALEVAAAGKHQHTVPSTQAAGPGCHEIPKSPPAR